MHDYTHSLMHSSHKINARKMYCTLFTTVCQVRVKFTVQHLHDKKLIFTITLQQGHTSNIHNN